jgi:hypothetical protein
MPHNKSQEKPLPAIHIIDIGPAYAGLIDYLSDYLSDLPSTGPVLLPCDDAASASVGTSGMNE